VVEQGRTAARTPTALPGVVDLSPEQRVALAALWRASACTQQATVPGLAQLVRVLCALGAPLDLVERAARSAAAQTRHARTAATLAGTYAGAPYSLPTLTGLLAARPARRPRAALQRLAVTAYREGCLVGGHAAQVATWSAATADDAAVRAVLAEFASEEALLTALWHDVLDWCLLVRPQLRRRLRRLDLPTASPVLVAYRGVTADPSVLAAHGWARSGDVARLWAAHRATVVASLATRAG
jgi:hypothetical protein